MGEDSLPVSNTGAWDDRVRASLEPCYQAIANAISGASGCRDLQFVPVKVRPDGLTLLVRAGERSGFLKLFDRGDPAAQTAYLKEKNVLGFFGATGLVTTLIAFSDPHRFIITSDAGARLDDGAAARWGPEETARRIGEWTARFDAVAPSRPATGNWYSYLRRFGDQLGIARVDLAHEILSQIPLCGQALARNDVALHNFLVAPDGRLVACDFEKSCVRPRGWDYMATFAALLQRFPDDADSMLDAYTEGFSKAHKGALIVDELNQVARFLFVSQAEAVPGKEAVKWQ